MAKTNITQEEIRIGLATKKVKVADQNDTLITRRDMELTYNISRYIIDQGVKAGKIGVTTQKQRKGQEFRKSLYKISLQDTFDYIKLVNSSRTERGLLPLRQYR
jgi:hypothetical protein